MRLSPVLAVLACLTVSALAVVPVVTIDELNQPNRVSPNFPVGKTLIFPVTASDSAGNALSFKVTSSNPKVLVRVKTGNPTLRLSVSYGSSQTGDLTFQLFRDWTPIAAGFIGGFAQAGFYDSLTFHRVVPHFVIQGGDPLGTGAGGPGMTNNNPDTSFSFENEFQPGLIFTGRGQLAMANSGTNTQGKQTSGGTVLPADYSASNGSQFFVTLENVHVPTVDHQINLDFRHTIFGQMLRGWDVLDAIGAVTVPGGTPATITSAKVEPNDHDAVLVLSAIGAGSSVITVTATNAFGGTATKTFTANAQNETINDPPFLMPIDPQVTPEATQRNVTLKPVDLESDFLFYTHKLLLGGAANAQSTTGTTQNASGIVAAILGNPGFDGKVTLGVDVEQFDLPSGSTLPAVDAKPITFGVGDKAVRPAPVTVLGAPGVALTNVVAAQLNDVDSAGLPSDFTATINWGDGTPVQSGSVLSNPLATRPGNYNIVGSHTYARAGTYVVVVIATGNKGAMTTVRSTAEISAAPLVAVGQELTNSGALLSNRLLATFSDTAPAAATGYSATVDWGDGVSSNGVVSAAAGGRFLVRGTHTYRDAEPYGIVVRIHKKSGLATDDVFAWSKATLTGFIPARHLPPFPVVHLVGEWSNSGPAKTHTNAISGNFVPSELSVQLGGPFVVFNSGALTSAPSELRFWLSNDRVVNPASDTALTVSGFPFLQVGSLAPGHGGSGNFTIPLPKGQSGAGKYLLTELFYSDPIMDAQVGSKVIVTPITGTVLTFDQSGTGTTRTGGKVTFKVVLDTQPSADVTIAVATSNSSEGTVSPNQLVFTNANWSTAQTVTVTGVADGKSGAQPYTVTLQSPSSTDPNFGGLSPVTISLTNHD